MKQRHIIITCMLVIFLPQRAYSANEGHNSSRTLDDVKERTQGRGRGQTGFLQSYLRSTFRGLNELFGDGYLGLADENVTHGMMDQGGESECLQDLTSYSAALQKGSSWALKMIDSTGRLGPDLLKGNFELIGDLDQCLAIREDTVDGHVIEGKSCVAYIPIPHLVFKKANIPQTLLNAYWIPSEFSWHVCVPKSCSEGNLTEFLQSVLQATMKIEEVHCSNDREISANAGFIVAVCIMSLIVLFNAVGSLYDVATTSKGRGDSLVDSYAHEVESRAALERGFCYENELKPRIDTEKRRGIWHKLLMSFSVVRNTNKLLSIHSLQPHLSRIHNNHGRSPYTSGVFIADWSKVERCQGNDLSNNELSCINGIRVISMAFIILGHTLLTMALGVQNRMDMITSLESLPMQAALNNAFLAVDTFFLLSGCLTSFMFLRKTEREGCLQCSELLKYFIHRWWRLTPLYMAVILAVVGLGDVIGGTQYDVISSACDNCRRNWWVNLLYINNIFRNTPEELCLGQSWFLSADMQFHWVAPLALVPLATGWTFLGCLVITAFICTQIITGTVFAYKAKGSLLLNNTEHHVSYYFMPYCRVSVFALGIAVAFMLHKRKIIFLKTRMRRCIGWTLSISICVVCMVITTGQWSGGVDTWSKWERVAHEVISRPVWALAVSWIIYTCCLGQGGWLNSVLSWSVWRPLGRLSYGAFLLHIAVLIIGWTNARTPLHFSPQSVMYNFIVAWVISYGLAFVFSVMVESPFIAIEKYFTRTGK